MAKFELTEEKLREIIADELTKYFGPRAVPTEFPPSARRPGREPRPQRPDIPPRRKNNA